MIILRATKPKKGGVKEIIDLDILDQEEIKLTISAIESGAIGETFGVSSQAFTLPATNTNQDFFGNIDNLNVSGEQGFIQMFKCQVLYNGDEIFTGNLYLNDIVTDQHGDTLYSVVVVNETVDFATSIKNLTVQDLDFSPYNHDYTYTNISQSWDNNLLGGDIVYPLIDYGIEEADPTATAISAGGNGRQFDNSAFPLKVTDFAPTIRAKAVIDTIFDAVGYTYTSSFLDTSYFENLYICSTQDDKKSASFINPVAQNFQAIKSVVQVETSAPFTPVQITFPDEQFDNNNNYDTGTSTFTAGANGTYNFYSKIKYREDPSVSFTTIRHMTILVKVNGIQANSKFINLTNSSSNTPYSQFIGPFSLNLSIGDDVTIEVIYAYFGGGTKQIEYMSGNDGCRFEAQGPSAQIGAPVDMSKIFDPQTKVEDILKGLIQKFNLVIEPVRDSRNVLSIQTFNDWVDQGTQVDWTNLIDRDVKFKIEHPLQAQPKSLMFSDIEDTDVLNQYYKDEFGKIYGDLNYISDSELASGDRKIGHYFSPTPIKGIDGAPEMILPALCKKEPNQQAKPFKYKPRILYNNGKVATSVNLKGRTGSTFDAGKYFVNDGTTTYALDEYVLFHHLDQIPAVQTTAKDLHFGNLNHWSFHQPEYNAFSNNSAFYEYWAFYINELYDVDARLLTCNIKLDPTLIPSIRLNDKIFIDGQYYRINKINGANLQREDSIEVQLLKTAPRKLKYPRRRVYDVYDGDILADVTAQDPSVNGTVDYVDFDTGAVLTEGVLIDQAAAKDGYTSYGDGVGGSTITWNYFDQTKNATFTSQQALGTNLVERSSEKVNISGDFNEVKANANNVTVTGDENVVREGVVFSNVFGQEHVIDIDNQRINILGGTGNEVSGSGLEDIAILNSNNSTVQNSDRATIIGGVLGSEIIDSDGALMLNPWNLSLTGTTNTVTTLGGNDVDIDNGNYHTVINPVNTHGVTTLDLDDYRFGTTVAGGFYQDKDVYMNRDGVSIPLSASQTYYAYSGEALFKYYYEATWVGADGAAVIEIPSIVSQEQYGRCILIKADSTISSTKTVTITVVGNVDSIDGKSGVTLSSPYSWVELRAGGENGNTEWRVINSSDGSGGGISGAGAYGSFYESNAQPLIAVDTSQSVNLTQTFTANDISLNSNAIQIANQGVYQFTYTAMVENADNTPHYANFWIKYNGVDFPNSNTRILVPERKNSTEFSAIPVTYALIGEALNNGDEIELYWEGDSTLLSLMATTASEAGQPNTPSVLANIHAVQGGGPTIINNYTSSTESPSYNASTGVLDLDGVKTVGGYDYSFVPVTSITGSQNLETIGYNAFRNNEITGAISIPSVTYIAEEAFVLSQALTSVSFSNSLTAGGFNNSITLQSASFASAETCYENGFNNCSSLVYVNMPSLTGSNALGGSPLNDFTFLNVADSGSINIPVEYQTNNSGNPDADLQYLSGKGWTINYV